LAPVVDKEEQYEEWLGRLDIPIEAQRDIETLRGYLRDELGITTDAQVEALWSATGVTAEYGEYGIRQVRVDYPWGVEVRYGIQGMPGLWGWAAVQQLRAGEDW
jgi:hypothetical protein